MKNIQINNDVINVLMIEDNEHDVFLANEVFGLIKQKKMLSIELFSCNSIESIPKKTDDYNLVFLDLNLPGTSGLETLETVLKILKGIPIIVFTGLDDEELGLECIRKGASDYLNKWDINNINLLYKTINYALERFHLLKNLKFKNELLNKQINIIEEKQERLNAIIETSVGGIITLNELGQITGLNSVACEIFNYPSTRLIDKTFSSLLEFPKEVDIKNFKWSEFNKIPLSYIIDSKLSRKPVKINSKEIVTDISKTTLIILKDLSTEMQAAETQIALAKQKELNELKSNFISIASHEFRTPLSTISSSTSLVKMYDNNPEYELKRLKHLDRIQSSVKHLVHILDDFLSVSKLEEGKLNIAPIYFDISEFGKDMVEEMQLSAKGGQLLIFNHKGNKRVFHDKKMFTIIIYNLLSNAIKYSCENAKIYFKTQVVDDTLTISIKDEGIGIPQNQQHQLFTRFFRAKNVNSIEGTGLGLNIVKKYVELLNGSIAVESELNVGSTFSLDFKINYA